MTMLAVTLDTMYDTMYDTEDEVINTNELIDDIGVIDAIEEGII